MSRVFKLEVVAMAAVVMTCGRLSATVVDITEGSASGYTMTDGNTYIIQDSVTFSNTTAGGSGMTVEDGATVVLYVPTGIVLTAKGANGSGTIGGGAGIRVPETSTLVITGEGTVEASGGNAGNGGNGGNGESGYVYVRSNSMNPSVEPSYSCSAGSGGTGGSGGGGGGAAIGGIGGTGGGNNGQGGGNGAIMGTVYVIGNMSCECHSSSDGGSGKCGSAGASDSGSGSSISYGVTTYYRYSAGGGGGGGGGGAGAAPKCSICGGGSSGGAGGRGNNGTTGRKVSGSGTSGSTGATGCGGRSCATNGAGTGGSGNQGGSSGSQGGAGSLYMSASASVNVDREKLPSETHSAAQYTITFNTNGCAISSSETNEITATFGCPLPECISTPVRAGCLFCGWKDGNGTEYYDADGSKSLSCYGSPSNVILHAEWVIENPILAITPEDGYIISDSQSVMISCKSSEAKVYYTLDGSDPTEESTVYQKRFRVSGKTTIKAIAVFEGWTNSEIVVARYALGQCPDPEITSDVGETFTHGSAQVSIAWECEDGLLRYTTDGSDVTEASPEYTGTLTIDNTTTVKARAFGETYFDSKQVVLSVTKDWESVAIPVIDAAETFTGGKTKVSMSCVNEDATIYYTLDGSEPNKHSMRYTGTFEVQSSVVVKAFAALSDYTDSEVSTKTITKMWVIGDSVGLPDHSFTTNGAAGWVDENGLAMRSGKISNNQVSILQSPFIGKGHLSFELKTSCEEDDPKYIEYDRAEIWIGGILQTKRDGIHDWETYEYDLDAGTHTVEWKYVKDDLDETSYIGEDCIWLRNVVWQPELTCTTQVPVKLDWIRSKYGDLGNYYFNYEEKANEMAANGHKVWECYVAGENPIDSNSLFQASVEMIDGTPIIHWSPDLNSNSFERVYTIWGKTNLTDKAWHPPTNECSHFFKVTVEMP